MSSDLVLERFNRLGSLLDDDGARLWHQYLQAEYQGIRKLALARLDAFIAWAHQQHPMQLDAWVLAYSEAVRASGHTRRSLAVVLPVRFSLLRETVLPRLFAGYHQRNPEAYSCLVVLSDFFYYTAPPEFLEANGLPPSAQLFLQEALTVNPDDGLALVKLIEVVARYFDYLIHEVPWGVLADDPQADLVHLEYFQALVRQSDQEEEYRNFITSVRRYLVAWREYLAAKDTYKTFAAYLISHNISLRNLS